MTKTNSLGIKILNKANQILNKAGQQGAFVDSPFHDANAIFPGNKILEENYETIYKECIELLKQKHPTAQELKVYGGNKVSLLPWNQQDAYVENDVNWNIMYLNLMGKWIEKNTRHCPVTTKLLKQMPEVATAVFSCLGPHTKLVPHYGYYKGFLRYHLGLIIPEDRQCGLVVDNIKYFWEAGKGVVFDDMYRHSAYNNSDQIRVVLYLDLYRPLPLLYKFLNKVICLFAPYSKHLRHIYSIIK